MWERFPTKQNKYQKIAQKAWRSKQTTAKPINIKGDHLIYKLFNGFVFVFEIKDDEAIVLITLYKHKGFNMKMYEDV